MIIAPARAMHHYPTREDNLLVCDSYVDASYMIAFSYPIVLIVVCTVYAVLTRKIPEAFNESKHIGECTRWTWLKVNEMRRDRMRHRKKRNVEGFLRCIEFIHTHITLCRVARPQIIIALTPMCFIETPSCFIHNV